MATLTKGKTFANGELVTPQKLHELVDLGTVSGIVNADISASAAIADTKLAQITTANKVANSATSATSANTTNTIVARDASGNFSAGTITAALSGNATTATTAASCSGNAATATTLQTARTINGVSFNGSANITVTADPNAHTHDATNITGTLSNARTTATSANTANAIVARDASGNFSAGTITAALSGNAATATTAASCSGNAATATTLQTARTINGVSFNGSANITVTADPNAHTHDDRYYTETEVNTLLAGKQAAGSYAPATGIAPSAITGTAVITTDSRLSDARTPTAHTHDDRYYTETEMNTLLAGKQAAGSYAAASHTHAISDTTGLQTALDGKQAAGSYVVNGGSVSSIQRVTAMPASPAVNTLYIVIP